MAYSAGPGNAPRPGSPPAEPPGPLDLAGIEADLLADEEETTLVIGRWSYLGSGWAREYAQEKAAQRQQTSPA